MATIYQVSELAGVSVATVSRVLNNNAKVSDRTREKVEKAMQELGYRPNSIAQSLASNRTNSVGVLVAEIHGPFFGAMMSGIESEFRALGKHVIFTTGHSNEQREKEGIDFLISRNCDALIVHSEALSDAYLRKLSKGNTPIFLISRHISELADRCISLDNEHGGYIATKALIDQGHRDIAYISGPLFKSDANQRLEGHKRALAEYNIAFDQDLVYYGDFQETGGADGLKYFIDSKQHFTALACGNDEMASGAMKLAREHGFSLPDDLSIIGFDNVFFTSYLYPRLSTINNPVDDMGHMVARMVLKDVYQCKTKSIQRLFTPSYVPRDSLAPYATSSSARKASS
ncbi:LacI family DNA-binding transcriptional regulator [Thalassotalea ponticola]|uniref:LacI family DNA-binding transcriptional regulator n=1 Tax=Thalassotalea ponticola TaxID=1523392 RepID=UPI0025B5106B|nr:LacI family DNA-binding transcriptional regulator [Thalassotalea ponticola]MDN3651604.1 LacI family DNA-binding transcriptional regulator [Thalassotalea ponticola]